MDDQPKFNLNLSQNIKTLACRNKFIQNFKSFTLHMSSYLKQVNWKQKPMLFLLPGGINQFVLQKVAWESNMYKATYNNM